MGVESQVIEKGERKTKFAKIGSSFSRMTKYISMRILMLIFTVVVGVFLTIMIANMGGYVDSIIRGEIRENLALQMQNDPAYQAMPASERQDYLASLIALEEEHQGLNDPFVFRAMNYLKNALVLDLGRSVRMTSDKGSKEVRNIILERLPPTLLLMGTSNFVLFLGACISLWHYPVGMGAFGIIGYCFFAYVISSILVLWSIFDSHICSNFKDLPFDGFVSSPPPQTKLGYALSVLEHMILPASGLIISQLFISIYNWRTFFLIYSTEDYVEMAKAKGLSDREIERRYILRPTLPNIITNFSLLLIGLWTGAIITETVFHWPGLGRTFFTAIGQFDTPVIVGNTIIFAYLLAVTVFLLDFVYALVDPRVKIGQ